MARRNVGLRAKRLLETNYVHALQVRAKVEIPWATLYRRNVSALRVEDRFVRSAQPGQCDLWALVAGGQHYEIECKRFGILLPSQVAWRDWCAEWRVPWLLLEVHRAETPAATLDRWMTELRAFLRGP